MEQVYEAPAKFLQTSASVILQATAHVQSESGNYVPEAISDGYSASKDYILNPNNQAKAEEIQTQQQEDFRSFQEKQTQYWDQVDQRQGRLNQEVQTNVDNFSNEQPAYDQGIAN